MEGNKPFTKDEVASLPNNWFTPSGVYQNRKQRRAMDKPLRRSKYNNLVKQWQFERDKNGKAKWIPHFGQRIMPSRSFTPSVIPPTSDPQT